MIPPAAVVFDLDGTLIDSRGDIVAALNHGLEAMNHEPLPALTIVGYVGDGGRVLCARALQMEERSDEVSELYDRFVSYYEAHPLQFTRWMPAAREALESLGDAGLKLGLCTNKARSVTDAILAALGVRTRFAAISAGGDISERKPAPGPLFHITKQLGIPPEAVVMVGDGPQDMEAAGRAGMRSIAVEHGFATRERLLAARPDVLIGSLTELGEVIRRWRDATLRVSRRR